jgi:uncharacterized membrane protein
MSNSSNGKRIIKTIIYQFTVLVLVLALTYIWFGNFTNSLAFTIFSVSIGTIWYFIYEYLWDS